MPDPNRCGLACPHRLPSVSNPDRARKLAFRFDGRATFNAVMDPEARLQVTVTGDSGASYKLLDAFTPEGIRIGQGRDLPAANGTVTLGNLPGGRVKLQLVIGDTERAIWYERAATLESATPITLTAGSTTEVTFAVP